MRLLFVCRMFDQVAGGVERMAIKLMNAMVDRGHEVFLFTWDEGEAQAYYPMREAIRWCRLSMGNPGSKASFSLRLQRMRQFRQITISQRPHVVIAFQHGPFLFTALSLLGNRIPVILAERNAPDRFDHTRAGRYRWIIFQTMRLAKSIVVQSEKYIQRYPVYLRARIAAIPNPVYGADGYATPDADRKQRTLLSVGRLSYQKNFAVLIKAFARISDEYPDWRLRIVGEGEERPALETLADELGIKQRVFLDGSTHTVSAEYRAADVFCLPSRWEGFPNALAEAMAHGLPTVAFRQCGGVDELIMPGHNGQLAEGNDNPDTLSRTMKTLMEDSVARGRLGKEAKRIVEKYEPGKVFDNWEWLFQKVAYAS